MVYLGPLTDDRGWLRPGWLVDDAQWSEQLEAMAPDDVRWLERQWNLAGGVAPAVDTSWVTTTDIVGRPHFAWPLLLAGCGLVVIAVLALLDWLT